MSQTIKVDMATQVDAWKLGVVEGQTYLVKHGRGMDPTMLDEHAEEVCDLSDSHQRRDWAIGFCRGFREGVRRGLDRSRSI